VTSPEITIPLVSYGFYFTGNSEEARSINTHLDTLRNKLYDYQQDILQVWNPFTKEKIKLKMFHSEIINDTDKLNAELNAFKPTLF